jgi:hypothetical protein
LIKIPDLFFLLGVGVRRSAQIVHAIDDRPPNAIAFGSGSAVNSI